MFSNDPTPFDPEVVSVRRTTLRLLSLSVAPVLLLGACGGDSKPKAQTNLSTIKVDTKNPKKPAVTIPKGGFKAGKQTATQVLQQGTGPAVSATQIAYVDYVAVDATTRKTLFSTFGQRFVPVPMSDTTQLPGLVKAIQGKKVGTTQKVAVPASQGFGAQGSSTLGVGATDTLVFYLRINAAANIATPAAGAQAPAPQGL